MLLSEMFNDWMNYLEILVTNIEYISYFPCRIKGNNFGVKMLHNKTFKYLQISGIGTIGAGLCRGVGVSPIGKCSLSICTPLWQSCSALLGVIGRTSGSVPPKADSSWKNEKVLSGRSRQTSQQYALE